MKYVIGTIGTSLCGEFKTRFTRIRCIDADCEENALAIYNKYIPETARFFSRSIGTMDDKNQLVILNFSTKYSSCPRMWDTSPGMNNYIVSMLLEEPSKLTEFGLYVPKVIQAKNTEDALWIYEKMHTTSRFKAYVLGYLDANDTFIVPNILDYVVK